MALDIETLSGQSLRPSMVVYPEMPVGSSPVESPLLDLPSAQTYRENLKDLRSIFQDTKIIYLQKHPSLTTVPRIHLYVDMSPLIVFRFSSPDDCTHQLGENIDNSFQFWEKLAYTILTEKDPKHVAWNRNRPIISAQYLDDHSNGITSTYQPDSITLKIGNITLEMAEWLIGRVAGAEDYFEFPDPNVLYLLAGQYFSEEFKTDILKRIAKAGLFKKDMLAKSVPSLSFIAEDIFNGHPTFFPKFMHGIISEIGGEEGFAVAAVILEDLIEIYKPAFSKSKGRYTSEEKNLFVKTLEELYERYQNWNYANRPTIVPPQVREEALQAMQNESDPSRKLYAYLEKIFTGIGAPEQFGDIFSLQDQILIRWIYERALQEKKLEAGQIPIMADILGFDDDQETLIWITNLMQILWKAILTHDDTVDQTDTRRGEETFHKQEGMAAGIQQPLLTIIKAARAITQKEGINNNEHSRAVLTMLDRLYSAEVSKPKIGWHSDYNVLEKNMIDIMQVLAWFPRYTVQREGLPVKVRIAGEKLAQYLEHYGCLVLIKNDCEDILEDASHPAGDDIGVRVNTFMHNLYNNLEIPEAEREEFRIICEDPIIKAKKKKFEQLDENDKRKIARALEIGRKYKHIVVRSLLSSNRNYHEARVLLDEALTYDLPRNDVRNKHYHLVFGEALDNLWKKLESYTS